MTLRADLIAAKALIDAPEKWIKHGSSLGSCYCAVGAIAALMHDDHRKILCLDALSEALPDGEVFVARFNDHPDTTHADIMALFDRAIASASPSQTQPE